MNGRVERVRQKFQAIRQAWSGTIEVGAAVTEIDTSVPDTGQSIPTRAALELRHVPQGSRRQIATADDEQNIGPGGDDCLPGDGT